MSTKNTVGFCPYCKQNVLMVKEAVNWALVIILIIFTGGIGLIVYGIIYYNKAPSRCIHCRSQITLASTISAQSSNQIQTNTPLGYESDNNADDSMVNNKTLQQNFCSFCGEPLLNKEAKFCAHCGTNV
ncbi:MAG: hypothetical protein HWN80_09140 [Candidatus Lokiarchaeota archaeon]|nr:hypothetical protein [Candidatus Lokiarchaeota archaeon]